MIDHRIESTVTDEIWSLYQTSFPETERIPKDSLQKTLSAGGSLISYRDDGFVGFTFHFTTEDMVFFVYLATDPTKRNRGYGEQILGRMRELNPGKRIFLVLEPCDEDAEDYELRVRRRNFYIRNGCIPTGIRVLSDDWWFDTMFVQGELTAEEMDSAVRAYERIYRP